MFVRIVKKIVLALFVLGLFSAGFIAVARAQDIIDWWKLRDYTPSDTVASLASNSFMSDKARKLFYVHDPVLLDKQVFQNSCTVGEATIVLGCYITNQRIYLYDVQEEKLAGVEEVTAAHEMLHAAYDRLSLSQRDEVNLLLDEAYERLSDERLLEIMRTYKERDESVLHTELHSVLGTELNELPKDLEEYYSQYFTDRSKVVALAQAYANEFTLREEKIASFDEQLAAINSVIVRNQVEMSEKVSVLESRKNTITGLRNEPAEYNREVDTYNQEVNIYNQIVEKTKELIDQYNSIVSERNAIAVEERSLVEAIDTRASEL